MKPIVCVACAVLLGFAVFHHFSRPQPVRASVASSPILVELFTSEGCSSCPPADALLQKLDTQPVPGLQLIVLSEHVDYWNHIGWTDPFSSHAYSERQDSYSRHFNLQSVYTPQMIVDGTNQLEGSNVQGVQVALGKARQAEKISMQLSDFKVDGGSVRGHVATSAVPEQARHLDVIVVLALNRAESQVARGENAGHRLVHVAVVRSLRKIGEAHAGKPFASDVTIPLDHGVDPRNLRVITFLQEHGPGRVWGAAEQPLMPVAQN